MDIEKFRKYCKSKPGCEEHFPFDDVTLVFKVCNKMFALLPLDEVEDKSVTLKGDPEENIFLREEYEGIYPGYHMNKLHWNTVLLESDVDDETIIKMVDLSYNLVLAKVPKKVRSVYGFE